MTRILGLKVDFQPVLRLTAAAEVFRAQPMSISTASVHDRSQVEQIDERRDTTLAIVLGRRQRFIDGIGRLQVRPLCWNEGTAAVRKRDEQELNAMPS